MDGWIGVGLKTNAGIIIPLVRLDVYDVAPAKYDGKGIHFNAVSLSDSSQKLAAVLKGTPELAVPARRALYFDYLKGLENRSAQFIWTWWSTGVAPTGSDTPEADP